MPSESFKYPNLFKPITLGKTTFRSRIFASPISGRNIDCACRPDMHGILIPGKRGRLLSVLYTAGREGLHPAVLLLHGIPGCDLKGQLPQ